MIEILTFIFSDITHFLGSLAILLIIAWGVANFNLVKISISNYHLIPGDFTDTEVDDEEL